MSGADKAKESKPFPSRGSQKSYRFAGCDITCDPDTLIWTATLNGEETIAVDVSLNRVQKSLRELRDEGLLGE